MELIPGYPYILTSFLGYSVGTRMMYMEKYYVDGHTVHVFEVYIRVNDIHPFLDIYEEDLNIYVRPADELRRSVRHVI